MLPVEFFEEAAKRLPESLEPIFETAREIRQSTDSEKITGAVLAAAMIKNLPGYETILAHLKLDFASIKQGIIWFNYLYGEVKDAKNPVRSGGIARDLAFGFTPTLQRFATNVSMRSAGVRTKLQQADHQIVINQMIDNLSKGGRKNTTLVGAYGSGRTTMINYFAETLLNANAKIPSSLKFSQIYSLDASSLISAATKPG